MTQAFNAAKLVTDLEQSRLVELVKVEKGEVAKMAKRTEEVKAIANGAESRLVRLMEGEKQGKAAAEAEVQRLVTQLTRLEKEGADKVLKSDEKYA